MKTLSRIRLLTALAIAIAFSFVAQACSVEQARNRCADESATADSLIECARKMYASTSQCASAGKSAATVPLSGRRIIQYGQVTKHGGTSQGTVFEGTPGASVRAPITGIVTFSDHWRSYGDLVIVDDCKTVALMAGGLSPEKIPGQLASAGDVVATMRKTADQTPVLYLEMRHNGIVIDPAGVLPPG